MDDSRWLTDEEMDALLDGHPAVLDDAERADLLDDREIDETVQRLVRGIVADARVQRTHRRRHQLIAVGATVVLAAAVGGTAAAMLARSGQPSRPEGGVLCQADAVEQKHAVHVGAGVDPIEACRVEWEHGSFAQYVVDGAIPDLVACIDPVGGVINVFPGDAEECAARGMEIADPELDDESRAVVVLQDRLAEEMDRAGCAPAAEVAERARSILDESELAGWQVHVNPGAETSTCAGVGVSSARRTVFITE